MHPVLQKLQEGEHTRQDFKHTVDDSRKIARTMCAFANGLGGRLWIGVKDNGRVRGTEVEEEKHMITWAAERYTRPGVQWVSQTQQVQGKEVLEVYVPASSMRPHQAQDDQGKWKTYLRMNDQTLLANRVIFLAMSLITRPVAHPVEYSDKEARILHYLREHPCITLSGAVKVSQSHFRQTEQSLSRLIYWGVLGYKWQNGRFVYISRSDQPDDMSNQIFRKVSH